MFVATAVLSHRTHLAVGGVVRLFCASRLVYVVCLICWLVLIVSQPALRYLNCLALWETLIGLTNGRCMSHNWEVYAIQLGGVCLSSIHKTRMLWRQQYTVCSLILP